MIIPCYNQRDLLPEAIKSVANQTHSHIEMIVVDDGSTDNTSGIARDYGVRCIRQPNRGVAEARNAGARAARADLLVFTDADDILHPCAVEAGLSCLSGHPEAAFVFGRPDVIGLADTPPHVEKEFYLHLLKSNFIWMPGLVLYRKQPFEMVGGFDPRRSGAADWDLYLRIARDFPIAFCQKMHGTYRRHSASMSTNSAAMFRDISKTLRAEKRRVPQDPQYRRAHRLGIETTKKTWGRWAAWEAREDLRRGRTGSAARAFATLLRYDPPAFFREVGNGARQLRCRHPGDNRD